VRLAIAVALMLACDAGEPYEKLPGPPVQPKLDERLLAMPPLAMPHGDFADRASYERALHDYASRRTKVVTIAACTGDACVEAAQKAGAGRLAYGVIERNGEKTYVALEFVGLAKMSYTMFSIDSVLDADRFFVEEGDETLTDLVTP
jgi:hypothetical protein